MGLAQTDAKGSRLLSPHLLSREHASEQGDSSVSGSRHSMVSRDTGSNHVHFCLWHVERTAQLSLHGVLFFLSGYKRSGV